MLAEEELDSRPWVLESLGVSHGVLGRGVRASRSREFLGRHPTTPRNGSSVAFRSAKASSFLG